MIGLRSRAGHPALLTGTGSHADAAIYIIFCVSKPNVNRQALVEAIATLEAQRGLAGDIDGLGQAINVALQALRDKLTQIQAEPGDQTQHQLAVLVADLSGYTTLSENMDVERVRDAMNAMWGVLDGVVLAWGGKIDQHAGDSLMALFGLPHFRQGDVGQALHAALSMQQELALFNERVRRATADPLNESWTDEWPGPSMRIGVHCGPVYFARSSGAMPERLTGSTGSGSDGRLLISDQASTFRGVTAVGDTIAKAHRLERAAPVGSILTSSVVERQARGRFVFSLGAASPPESDDTYLVQREMPMATAYVPGRVAGRITPLVGRTELLDKLQLALQIVADSRTPYLMTLVGRPGAGKSRLVHEFEKQARMLDPSLVVLRAGTQGAFPDFPYALIRDFLLRQFSIRPQYSPYFVRHRLAHGLAEIAGRSEESAHLPAEDAEVLALLERLLDPQTAAAIPMDEIQAVFARLLSVTSARSPVIMILEGINRADRQSLDLVERLVDEGQTGGVLFLGLATSTEDVDPRQTLPWLRRRDDIFGSMERLDIPTLSAVDSRLMVGEILNLLTPLPMRLMDLVVAESGGNSLYIETMVRLMIERKVLLPGDRWQVDMNQVESDPLPVGLPRLIEAQLANLSPSERKILQYAAIFGPLCWDTALVELLPEQETGAAGVEEALLSLELQEYLAADGVYSFSASQAYAFRRDSVRDAAYASVPPQERRELHLRAANWLIATQGDTRLGAWYSIDSMIAGHFAAAGEGALAESWRRRPGNRAGTM